MRTLKSSVHTFVMNMITFLKLSLPVGDWRRETRRRWRYPWNENVLDTEGGLCSHDTHFKAYMAYAGEERESEPCAFERIEKHKREPSFKNYRIIVCCTVRKGWKASSSFITIFIAALVIRSKNARWCQIQNQELTVRMGLSTACIYSSFSGKRQIQEQFSLC